MASVPHAPARTTSLAATEPPKPGERIGRPPAQPPGPLEQDLSRALWPREPLELTMIKIKHLLLAAAMAFTLCDVSLRRRLCPSRPAWQRQSPRHRPPRRWPKTRFHALGRALARLAICRHWLRRLAGAAEAKRRSRLPLAPAQAPLTGAMPIGGPYLVTDPFLDPPEFPQPGWFAGAEAQIVKPHLITRMEGSVIAGKNVNWASGAFPLPGYTSIVNLPSANLSWDRRSPRFSGLPPSLWIR